MGLEIAVAGRSNAGKSSAINVLTHIKSLARTSKTPGRTQQINVFSLGETESRLIDLPGYGYAEVSPALQQHWARVMPRYLLERASLVGLLIAMDIRHPLREGDLALIDVLSARQLPTRILLTKCDKLSRSAQLTALRDVNAWCQEQGEFLSVQLFSSLKRLGVDPAREWVQWHLSDPASRASEPVLGV